METKINKPKKDNNSLKFINKDFNQLNNSNLQVQPTPTIDEQINSFFIQYDSLFFDINKTGNQSHQTLVNRSSDYLGEEPNNDLINALLAEIDDLRSQNNILNQTLQEILNNI